MPNILHDLNVGDELRFYPCRDEDRGLIVRPSQHAAFETEGGSKMLRGATRVGSLVEFVTQLLNEALFPEKDVSEGTQTEEVWIEWDKGRAPFYDDSGACYPEFPTFSEANAGRIRAIYARLIVVRGIGVTVRAVSAH